MLPWGASRMLVRSAPYLSGQPIEEKSGFDLMPGEGMYGWLQPCR